MLLQLVAVRVTKSDLGERGATAGIMDNVCDHALDVPVALRCVQASKTRLTLAMGGVRREDGAAALPLRADDAPHLQALPLSSRCPPFGCSHHTLHLKCTVAGTAGASGSCCWQALGITRPHPLRQVQHNACSLVMHY